MKAAPRTLPFSRRGPGWSSRSWAKNCRSLSREGLRNRSYTWTASIFLVLATSTCKTEQKEL